MDKKKKGHRDLGFILQTIGGKQGIYQPARPGVNQQQHRHSPPRRNDHHSHHRNPRNGSDGAWRAPKARAIKNHQHRSTHPAHGNVFAFEPGGTNRQHPGVNRASSASWSFFSRHNGKVHNGSISELATISTLPPSSLRNRADPFTELLKNRK